VPLSRAEKEQAVTSLQEHLAGAENAILVDYLGLKVEEVNDLRRKVRECDGTYRVVKNTLALLAIQGAPVEALKEEFQGPIAVATHPDSPVVLAKVLMEFAKEHGVMEIKVGILDGRPVDAEGVKEFASMPTMEDLHVKLAFLLQSPLQRTAAVLKAVQRNLAVVLKEGAAKKEQ